MKFVISVAIACAIVLITLFVGLDRLSSDPSTEQVNADLAAVHSEIARAEADRTAVSGGAIENLFTARIEILRTTAAMLEQKRSSMLRRIDLAYTVDGERAAPNSEAVASIEREIKVASAERDRMQAEAARYSGGLIQTMALLNAATTEVSIAQLNQARLAEQYGFYFRFSVEPAEPQQPIGQSIVDNDGDAL
ncbi:hypothetical protein JHL21_13305 [Devosia sp. WQ 349]|uniref:hypothetical protein n=1 Tax=Devosia sp. WQ 349K1 TaxID=2800329 RepID=UPI001906EB88|nr:hypothetical protein [Devosia sp. WQ 349K1]MBK1795474.1 hypothetical protein [Devosia sp. WQ 349K1]